MKIRKFQFLLAMMLCCIVTVHAQTVEVTTAANGGNLKAQLAAKGITDIETASAYTELKISGGLTAADFTDITASYEQRTWFYKTVEILDLSGVTWWENGEFPASSFYEYTKLQKVILPVNSGLKTIGKSAFLLNLNLSEINLPEGIERIDEQAFNLTPKLKSVALPQSLKVIARKAFGQGFVKSGLESLVIPAGVTRIEGEAFANTQITEVNLPAGLQELGAAFMNTNISSFTFPEGVTIIDGNTDLFFRGCANLKTVSLLPSNVTTIGESMFDNSGITSFVVPEGVTSIGYSAFQNTTSLTSVEIPESVTYIGPYAFYYFGANALTSVKVHNPLPVILEDAGEWGSAFYGIDFEKCVLYVPEGSKELYAQFDVWKQFENIVEFGDKQSQVIENFQDITASVGQEITLSATATSGLEVTYSIEEGKESVASLNGKILTIKGPGDAKITATQSGNDEYQAVEEIITLSVSVNYTWIEVATLVVEGDRVKVAGTDAGKFVKFFVNNEEAAATNGYIELSEVTGIVALKATSADGSQVIRLKISR